MDNTCQTCGRSDCQCPSIAELTQLRAANAAANGHIGELSNQLKEKFEANATLQQQVEELKKELAGHKASHSNLVDMNIELVGDRDQLKQENIELAAKVKRLETLFYTPAARDSDDWKTWKAIRDHLIDESPSTSLASFLRERDKVVVGALEDILTTGCPPCHCGHPTCKPCKATKNAELVLANLKHLSQ